MGERGSDVGRGGRARAHPSLAARARLSLGLARRFRGRGGQARLRAALGAPAQLPGRGAGAHAHPQRRRRVRRAALCAPGRRSHRRAVLPLSAPRAVKRDRDARGLEPHDARTSDAVHRPLAGGMRRMRSCVCVQPRPVPTRRLRRAPGGRPPRRAHASCPPARAPKRAPHAVHVRSRRHHANGATRLCRQHRDSSHPHPPQKLATAGARTRNSSQTSVRNTRTHRAVAQRMHST